MKIPNLLLLAALLAAPAARADDRRPVDRVAAVVNGDVITLSELAQRSGAEYRRAFERAGLAVEHDPEGLIGRGLFIGLAPDAD